MRTCLNERERYNIEYALKAGQTVQQIAATLERAQSCIYAEIKRGTIEQLNSDLTVRKEYCADVAQRRHAEKCQSRGVGLKISNDIQLAKFLENKILSDGYSPYAAMQSAKNSGYNVPFSLSTLYNYIRGGVFEKLNKKHLNKRRKHNTDRRQAKKKYNKNVLSIEQRDRDINKRQEFGHWEIDTVVGRQGTTTCLLVLTERKTRYELIRKMSHKSAECTAAELDKLEIEYGDKFKRIFKTVTSDNGCEFFGGGIVNKSVHGGERFKMYYCHPYRSNERGSNELQNRFIRRFIKKGVDIAGVSKKRVKEVQDYINSYPRKLFDGLSAADMLAHETGFI
jgi:IS30 family transposase